MSQAPRIGAYGKLLLQSCQIIEPLVSHLGEIKDIRYPAKNLSSIYFLVWVRLRLNNPARLTKWKVGWGDLNLNLFFGNWWSANILIWKCRSVCILCLDSVWYFPFSSQSIFFRTSWRLLCRQTSIMWGVAHPFFCCQTPFKLCTNKIKSTKSTENHGRVVD